MQPCVWRPRDPVTGAKPKHTYGMYGPHVHVTPKHHWFFGGKRIMWMEYPVDVEILQGTPHALILPALLTMWARCVW